jgi:hypothetical protein
VTAGYSGTPLAKKLGVKPGTDLCLLDAPPGWVVPGLPDGVRVVAEPGPEVAVTVAFCRDRAALAAGIESLGAAIFPDRALWVAWPRKAGGHVSDLDENGIRELALPGGLVDIKVAAIDTDWSGLKLVWRKERRG